MDRITLENFRCFRERQTVRLAPLTLLVGENSTGKTSFMALARALSDSAYGFRIPDFKEDPYDLGSFDEIAHHRGGRRGRASTFVAGFNAKSRGGRTGNFDVTFAKSGTAPIPVSRHLSQGRTRISEDFPPGQPYVLKAETSRGTWQAQIGVEERASAFGKEEMPPTFYFLVVGRAKTDGTDDVYYVPLGGSPSLTPEDLHELRELASFYGRLDRSRPYASAPVRSRPRRTYDPSRPTPDPEGDYVPMYLAEVLSGESKPRMLLKERLEEFGRVSGLFDEISIKRLGRKGSEPFQVQIRKFGSSLKGPQRNLIDVGYGVSQVLPVITELLREDAPSIFLLQQPEVHLHPRAQAALGSLFCQVAGPRRQLIVESHSDHLLNRVRMDVRDGASKLKPSDVSILYFERNDLDVQIHSLWMDEEGNILNAPDGYGKFFMEETTRSLWKPRQAALV